MQTYIQNFIRYKYLLKQLVIRDIKVKYKRSVLGILWSILNPLLMMTVINIVFSNLFRVQIENFIVYYLTGNVFFAFMSEATGTALTAVFGNAALIMKVYIPKYIFPLAKALSAFVNLLFSLVAVAIMVIATGVKVTPALLFMPLILFYLLIFTIGFSLIFATYAVFFRDLLHLHGVMMAIWMYLTPIMYPPEILPESYRWILNFNPIYYFIRYFRQLVLDGKIPSLELNLICIMISFVSLAIGLLVFYRNQNKFILHI